MASVASTPLVASEASVNASTIYVSSGPLTSLICIDLLGDACPPPRTKQTLHICYRACWNQVT